MSAIYDSGDEVRTRIHRTRTWTEPTGVTPGPPAWWADAACGTSTVDFFPGRGDHAGMVAAKAVCAGCPVTVECLAFAFTTPRQKWGVWGGLSERERRNLRSSAVRVEGTGEPGPPARPAPGALNGDRPAPRSRRTAPPPPN